MNMYCPKCGKWVQDEWQFCSGCGASVTKQSSGTEEPSVSPAGYSVSDTARKKISITAWLMAFVPLLGLPLVLVTGYGKSYWILNIILGFIDEYLLKKQGIDTSSFGKLAFFVPYYLYKRAKVLGDSLAYFIVWIVLFIVTLPF